MTIFNDLEVLIHVIDLKTYEFLYVNPYSQNIFGDVKGRRCWQIFYPSKKGPCTFCPNEKLFNDEGKPAGAYVWEMKIDFNGRWYVKSDKAIILDDGRFAKLQVAIEVNKRLKAEEELFNTNHEWEQIFDAIPDAVAVIDNQFHIEKVNASFARQQGAYPKENYEGQKCFEVIHAANKPPVFCPHQHTLQDGKPHREDIYLDQLGGFFNFSVSPITDADGSVTKCVHIAHDITKRKLAEELLQEAHDTLEKRVAERTERLDQTNLILKRKVKEHQKALEQLKKKALELDEANITLRVLSNQGNEAKRDLEQKIISNLTALVIPYINALERKLAKTSEAKYLDIIKENISVVTSSFSHKLSSKMLGLTSREIQIAHLIKEGKANKEIAEIMLLSVGTVETYRNNIRKKLGIKNKKINLRSYLLSQFGG